MLDLGQSLLKTMRANRSDDAPPQLCETHISWVLLDGENAWKIKKPVDLGFADFSTLAKRRHYCEEEIRLNSRLAPDLYLDVVPIMGSTEQPRLAGDGEPIDYAVKMKRFRSEQLLKDVAARGELRECHIDQLADTLSHFHANIDTTSPESELGHKDLIWQSVAECIEPLQQQLIAEDPQKQLQRISSQMQSLWDRFEDDWTQRREQGFVRECHGDLHLGNIALMDNKVTVFDGIDFNPELRWIDVMSEIAFTMMDLERRGLRPYAYRLLNRYCESTGDYEGVKQLPFYIAYRALVRAKVKAIRWSQQFAQDCIPPEEQTEMDTLLNLAENYSVPSKSRLLITHGFSGSGKSTATQQVLEQQAAIRIRSDVERKRVFDHENSSDDLYSEQATEQTYERLSTLAQTLIQTRFPVIIDATFLSRNRRNQFRQVAEQNHVEFTILDFRTPPEILRTRIRERSRHGHDASDADLDVLEMQLSSHDPIADDEGKFVHVVDTTIDNMDKANFAKL